jgi:phenylpropionate dioxygenase-like ring-hydroxylating dioxygenase large terminal subunit
MESYEGTPLVADEDGAASGIDRAKAPEPQLGNAPIDGSRYSSAEFARREWEGLWTKAWLVGALESDMPEAGDFITVELGAESILLVRGDDGQVRAFYNVCQHRGNRLVEAEQGSMPAFTCAYHAWRWSLEGELLSVPDEGDFPQGSPCGKVRLEPVQCESFAGFIWYCLDPQAAPLAEFLGEVAGHIESYRMETMVRTHWVTVEGRFNWKCVQDNFNESYHLEFVHPQTRYIMETRGMEHQQDLYPTGHARILIEGCRPDPRYAASPDVAAGMAEELAFWELDAADFKGRETEMRAALQTRKRELGVAKGYDFGRFSDAQLTDHYHYSIFPNLSLSLKPDGCIFLRANPHPTDPSKCLFDMWYFTLFPEGVTEYHSHTMDEMVSVNAHVPHVTGSWPQVSCGPAIDQDVRIWNAQQKGLTSRGYRGGYLAWQERRVRYLHDNLDRWLG